MLRRSNDDYADDYLERRPARCFWPESGVAAFERALLTETVLAEFAVPVTERVRRSCG
jgi:hypothetical protein